MHKERIDVSFLIDQVLNQYKITFLSFHFIKYLGIEIPDR